MNEIFSRFVKGTKNMDTLVFGLIAVNTSINSRNRQATREQRDEDGREAVRLLVLEAVVAGDVALRGGKEDHAEDSAVHGALLSARASSRVISSAAAWMRAKSCFTPAHEYARFGPVKSPISD